MKLISCHIRNFGNLSNIDYKFADGINSFIGDNGFGKSTLAAFVKAMLFGMEAVRESDKELKERKHYAPFNEQSYGGTLVFEHSGKEYRVERTFDVKSAVKDSLTIYEDKEEKEFEREIGEEILGLDKESFERLLFLNSQDIKMESNGNIRKNLNNIIDDSAEGVDFDAIIEKLSEVAKKYSNKKTSLTSGWKVRKKELEETIANQEIISSNLSGKYAARNELNEERTALEKKQEIISKQTTVLEYWKIYKGKLAAINDKKESLDKLMAKYPKGYPTDEEINTLSQLLKEKTSLLGTSKGIVFDDVNLVKLNSLKEKYSKGIPTEEQLLEVEKDISEHTRLTTLSNANKQELTDEEVNIYNRFNGRDGEKDLARAEQLVSEYKTLDDSLKSTPKFEEGQVQQVSAKSKLPLFILIPSILLIGVGIAMFFVLLGLGIALTAVGAIGLFTSAFLYLKNRIDSSNKGVVKINDEFTKIENQLRLKGEEIHQVLTRYGIYTQSVYSDFERFKVEYGRYQEILKKKKEASEQGDANKQAIESLEKGIKVFLDKYGSFDNFAIGLQKVKDEIKELNNLSASYDSHLNKKGDNDKKLADIDKAIKAIDDKYQLGVLEGKCSIETISADCALIKTLISGIARDEEDAEQYKNEKGLIEEPASFETEDYSEKIKALSVEILTLDNQIDDDERDIEALDDNRQLLFDVKKEIEYCEHKFDILTKLEAEIHKAQKALDDKYVAPIMEKFEFYSNLLGDLLGVQIEMGRDFDIKLNVDGKLRSDEHLSSGQRSICALCFRLALLDNIYGGNIPFIIMDDPFLYLDPKNLKSTIEMLKKLAADKQIIYFSCHPSRAI